MQGTKAPDIRSGSFAEVMPDRVADKVHHALYVEFLEDVHAVGADGLNAEMQFFRHLRRGFPLQHQTHDLKFPVCKALVRFV